MARNENKMKSTGFLDTFFGRKHKVYGTSGAEDQHEQDISIGVAKLTIEEINIKFMEILEDMNIPKDKREPLMQKDVREKREMLIMHYKGKVSSWNSSRFERPNDYKLYLKEGDHSASKILQCVESLRVALTSNPISWIKEFGEEGIDEIVGLLQKCKQRRDYDKIEFECIRCLKAILNNSWGINVVLKPEQHAVVLLLAQSLDISKPQSMCEALKLLAGFCLLNERNGYNKVLSAISCASTERFKPIVDGLFVEHDLEERGQRIDTKGDLCYNSLLFINTIINTPNDLNFRLHLRCEVMRTGLYERLDTLGEIVNSSNNEPLAKHYKIFISFKDDDFEEFSSRFDNIRMEIDDINDCFEILRNTVVDTSAEPYFLSILQHLLYIRDDYLYKPAYYKLIEECISQIVLHKNGCDPNFKSKDFHIDTSVLLDDLAERNKAMETKRVDELEKKIEELQAIKQETEAKVAHLEEKLKNYANNPTSQPGGGGNVMMGKGPPIPPPPPPPMGMIFNNNNSGPATNTSGGPPGPPPPPPPPMFGGGKGMGPPPPPPPNMPGAPVFNPKVNTGFQLPSFLKPKKKYVADGPMKRANWKPIAPDKLSSNSLWTKIHEDELPVDDIVNGLSQKFSTKPIKVTTKDTIDRPSAPKKNVDVKVLDGKAAQSLSILLGGPLKHMTHAQIKSCLWRCDTKTLSPNVLQLLKQYLPPPKELTRLIELKKNNEVLPNVEEFIVCIAEIKRLRQRLESLHFMQTLPDMMNDVKPDIVAGTSACEEIKNCEKFTKILELILLFGNYMNAGSKQESVYAFEISFLTKLSNTKDVENKETLLHYLVSIIETKFPEILNFYEDIPHIDKAARISLDNIKRTMTTLKSSVKNVENDLAASKVPQNDEDAFIPVFGEFISGAKQQVEVLGKMVLQMEKLYKEISEFFSFDINKYTMEDFFTDIKTFKDSYIQALQDNIKERTIREKNERALAARQQHERDLLERQQRKLAIVDIDAAQTQEGVMDSLLEALQTGSAFGNRERRKRNPVRPAGAERRAQLSRSRSRKQIGLTSRENNNLLFIN